MAAKVMVWKGLVTGEFLGGVLGEGFTTEGTEDTEFG